ncbi:right-handed parallel beta-helix repeat-containing protein [Allorhizocola rhizosphaerae]|uniref:pectate lyase family protein n=1 Tax=Allorhizocola rhizosphaerae TaxID=1872709 RepID=UPI001FE54386|nr:right-handed parallel beta-helix repeat-containing protein [Allorhizocola rhizosphaerae]
MMNPVRLLACASLLGASIVALSAQAAQAATVRYEAETSPATCSGTIDSNHAGFSGSGFCNGTNAVGAAAQFAVSASASGSASVAVRYANGTTANRPANLIVNGATLQTPSFGSTGTWTAWTTATFTFNLPSGNSTIQFSPTTADGLPNIDFIEVTTGGVTQPPTGLVGWATQGGGTTGGGNASPTTVSSLSALTSALSSGSAAVIRVSGTISCSGMLRVASNKTVLGNSGATIAGCGFNISNASNVIVRNLTFRDWDDDAINVQYSTRVWIDHNSFTNGYDGAVDVKRASDFVTVSWNRFFNHSKTMLLGHSDDNGGEDRGHLRVSYHHNWFDGTNSRHPRVRFGNPVHVFSNYYGNVGDYGVASTLEAGVLVEGNYFENTDSPCERGQGSSPAGSLVQRNNFFVSSGSCQSGGSVASIPYQYSLDPPSNVKSIVTGGAGAGRISV